MCGILFWVPPSGAQQTSWRDGYFPNAALTDHNGRTVRFYDDLLRGKVVAISFVFTNCTDVCPLDIAQMRRVQEILGDRVGRDIHFYSISINPERDTPVQLRRTMQTYGVGPGWTFLTGSVADIDELQRRFGLNPAERDNLGNHEASIIMGNEATGQWIKRSSFESPHNLANILGSTLNNYAQRGDPTARRQSYAVAGQVTDTSRGAYLYRTRCQACHTIGGGDRLGPDLRGVAGTRNEAWLHRWIREPDVMIAERDPLAVSLLARYRNLPMPNLGLGENEVREIVGYLRQQDATHQHRGAPAAR
ncbi:cytochrome oxidase biogenesis protein Sco1/SenC/PrrC [alpha proteobacterium U9-1i]|nr:cytochrome oxidase biogenesis protein Sco1/SenC/PrrC [alpha proteobacterium U9-1i]